MLLRELILIRSSNLKTSDDPEAKEAELRRLSDLFRRGADVLDNLARQGSDAVERIFGPQSESRWFVRAATSFAFQAYHTQLWSLQLRFLDTAIVFLRLCSDNCNHTVSHSSRRIVWRKTFAMRKIRDENYNYGYSRQHGLAEGTSSISPAFLRRWLRFTSMPSSFGLCVQRYPGQ